MTLTPAFYKGKLVQLVEIARESVRHSREQLKAKIEKSDAESVRINLITEFSDVFIRILLMCALGEDVSTQEIDYWENSKCTKRSVSFVLRETFAKLIERMALPSLFFFPFLANVFLTPHERDVKANALTLRTLIQGIVDRRRAAIAKDESLKKAGDFLTILLIEPFFANDNERIIDECLTFFFAGSQTSAITTQNLVVALIKHPEYQDKLLQEFEEELIKPHFKEEGEKNQTELTKGQTREQVDILDMIDFETGSNLKLYINCFNESLRMMPPVYFSSSVTMSENVQCGPLAIRKGDSISISMYHLCNNPNEWIEPRTFIPERFDHESKYHLTPDGKKRNPYSFSPFLGGARICIGKTFVEAVSKLVLPTLLQSFKFDFEKGVDKDKFDYPHNNMVMDKQPEIHVMISNRNH